MNLAKQEVQRSYLYFFFIGRALEEISEAVPLQISKQVKPKNDLRNYRLSEEDFANRGGAKTRFQNNIEAIKLIKLLHVPQITR